MNGRLQRFWGLARLALALFVGWHWGWAWGLASLALQALLLVPGFAQLLWVNRGPDAPGFAPLLRAWTGEVLASELAFSWRQPWREWAEPDHLPAGARHGVLLVHGFACNRGRWNGWMRWLRADGLAFVAPSLEPAFGSIDAYADEIEAGVRRLMVATGRMPVVCAHSMGGLAVRAWWRRHGAGHAQPPQVITLGTPHQGTRMARLLPGARNVAQMRRGSAWLAELPGLPTLLCLWTRCDQVVNPAATARLAGAQSLRVDGVGHMGLVHAPAAWAVLQQALAADPRANLQADAGADSSFSTPRRI